MSNVILPLFATIALSAIASISGMHYHQVSKMVAENQVTTSVVANTAQPIDLSAHQSNSVRVDRASNYDGFVPATPIAGTSEVSSDSAREEAYLKLLAQQTQMLSNMRNEQKNLVKQLSEANRDIDELTFRVDSHSTSFRPLRVNNERPRTLNSDIPAVDGDATGLLPPKQ